jgi:hypothetical protein
LPSAKAVPARLNKPTAKINFFIGCIPWSDQ